MDKEQKRMRFTPTGMQVREMEGEAESRVVEGCAIVFGQETTLYDGEYYREREIIAPGCVSAEFLAEQDIKLNLLHERNMSVARNNKGEGTLELDLREDGLYFSAVMPKCDLGDQVLELVRNKTYTGCSFEFYPKDYTIDTSKLADGREDDLITHTSFYAITALTIAMDPAYAQTSVGEREQKREAEVKVKAELAMREEADEASKKEQEIRDRVIAQVARETESY